MKSGWWSRRAITLHVAVVLAVPSFLALGRWQLGRALQGNTLSWAYTFEWPFFAAYAIWMWWKLVHEEVAEAAEAARTAAPPRDGRPAETDVSSVAPAEVSAAAAATESAETMPALDWDPYDEADPELAAYNRYLANLHTQRSKP